MSEALAAKARGKPRSICEFEPWSNLEPFMADCRWLEEFGPLNTRMVKAVSFMSFNSLLDRTGCYTSVTSTYPACL